MAFCIRPLASTFGLMPRECHDRRDSVPHCAATLLFLLKAARVAITVEKRFSLHPACHGFVFGFGVGFGFRFGLRSLAFGIRLLAFGFEPFA